MPARAGPRAGVDPLLLTRGDRRRCKRVWCADRRGAGYRIPFWSGHHRTPARPAGPLRVRAGPAPPFRSGQTGRPAGRARRRSARKEVFSIESGGSATQCAIAWRYHHSRCPTAAWRARYVRNAKKKSPSRAAGRPALDRQGRGAARPPRRRRPLPGTRPPAVVSAGPVEPSGPRPAPRGALPAPRIDTLVDLGQVGVIPASITPTSPRSTARRRGRASRGELADRAAALAPLRRTRPKVPPLQRTRPASSSPPSPLSPRRPGTRPAGVSGGPAVLSLPLLLPDREWPGGRPAAPGTRGASSLPPSPWHPSGPAPGRGP